MKLLNHQKALIVVLTIMIVVAGGYLANNYYQSTQLATPSFKPEKFRFIYVRDTKDLQQFVKNNFPLGTDRAYLEKILVEHGDGTIQEIDVDESNVLISPTLDKHLEGINFKSFVKYGWNSSLGTAFASSGRQIFAFYDDTNKLTQIFVDFEPIY